MIRRLSSRDISRVAKIHKEELLGFLPELGEDFLQAFYETSLSIPEMFTYIYTENDQISGFVSGIPSARGLYRKIIFKNPYRFGWLFLKYIITHPMNIIKMARTLTYPGFSEDDPELLTIAVSAKSQKRGIGRKLFMQVVREFRKKKIREFKISVYGRLPANGFYKKIGCRLDSTFNFLGEKMHYYLYKINS